MKKTIKMLPEQANHTEHMETFIKACILNFQHRDKLGSKMIHFKHADILKKSANFQYLKLP